MTVKDIFDRPAPPRRLMICTGPCCNTNGLAKLILDELQTKLLHAMACDELVAEAACVRRSCLADRVKTIRSRAITIVRRTVAHFARSGRENRLS